MGKHIRAKKRYGQNFLIDNNVLNKIVDSANLSDQDTVLEIGMGTGILTEALAKKAGKVIGIEIDEELFPDTKQKLEKYMNVNFIMGDFLKHADEIFAKIDKKIKVIANIPYYITTPIIEKLFEYRDKVESVTLMVQKEVALRINATPGNKNYGSLTLYVQYYADTSIICNVPPEAFRPSPKVDSAVIRLDLLTEPRYNVLSEKRLFSIIRSAFWGRRKTLNNCLKKSPYTHYTNEMVDKLTQATGIDFKRRGETLSLEEYVSLAGVKL